MALLTPSGDTTGATDLAAINAMTPNDELGAGTYYVNDTITATVIRGVEWAHWQAFFPTALTTITPVPGTYAEGAALVNHVQGYYEGFTLDGGSMGAGFNGAEISGSKELTLSRVQIQNFPGVGLRSTGADGVLGLRFCQSRVQGCGDWGVKIDNMSDSLFYDKFDISNCGQSVDGTGGIYIVYGIGNGFCDGEIQDMYNTPGTTSGGGGLQIDGGDLFRIMNMKFDQIGDGAILFNGSGLTVVGNALSGSQLGTGLICLRLGPKANYVASAENIWYGTAYACDPRDASVGPLIGRFRDVCAYQVYADAGTQTIMHGLVA